MNPFLEFLPFGLSRLPNMTLPISPPILHMNNSIKNNQGGIHVFWNDIKIFTTRKKIIV
ncbi:hypothetical protein DFA_03686 [Cavenderia fasciculata]|uniref:Uncharacterized protein n=1 Tax=Cavenderia fasciculata TaxID=261658 RepID=F4Q1P9_CACFS|nr:uncharacterized protein DFA_03686 [Cavenderia fasciculata]EGG18199.1 hypothetical protein DFA_03686 [Cavenderia fasciculata]|eukprot:XP_004357022.1 hypothetical protein DFA_03686 [Cavenderia fasciculata]